MSRDEVLSLSIKSGKIRFDEQICTAFSWDDFDNDKFKTYLKLAKISDTLERDELLKNLKVLTQDGMTNAGVLYFSKEPSKYIISSQLRCVHFKDNERMDILDKKVVDKGIIGNNEFAVEYLKERVPVRYEIHSLARNEYPEYPLSAYREAVVNAVIHFDYFLGDMIAVEKSKDKIVINNKGELLFSEEEFGRKSEARNRLLADLLSRTEYMEKAGTGIKRIQKTCLQNKNSVKFSFTDSFWVEIEKNVTENATERLEKIIELIQVESKISTSKMAEVLNVSKRTILRDLNVLKEKGKVHRKGSEKNGHWEILN